MFFDGIGIDLHFIHEQLGTPPQAAQTFGAFHHAGRRTRPDAKAMVAAFLLNETDQSMERYAYPYATSVNSNASSSYSDGADHKELVTLNAHHTCDQATFLARIWRSDTVLGTSGTKEDDRVSVKILQNVPGQESVVLHEAGPFAFPANKKSLWIDTGSTAAYMKYDICVEVERPGKTQTIKATYVHQRQSNFVAAFPGVRVDQVGYVPSLHPRVVVPGSEDEFELCKHIEAHIGGTSANPTVVEVGATRSQKNDGATRVPASASISQTTSPALSELPMPPHAFKTLIGSPPAGSQSTEQAPTPSASSPAEADVTAQHANVPQPSQPSPALPYLSWQRIRGAAASAMAPILPSTSPGLASAVLPPSSQMSAQSISRDQASTMDTSAVGSSFGLQPPLQSQGAAEANGSETQSVDGAAQVARFIVEMSDILQEAADDLGCGADSQQRGDVSAKDQAMQTDAAPQNAGITGVSYVQGSDVNMASAEAGTSLSSNGPLLLPAGSGQPSGSHTKPATDPAMDVDMEDGERVSLPQGPSVANDVCADLNPSGGSANMAASQASGTQTGVPSAPDNDDRDLNGQATGMTDAVPLNDNAGNSSTGQIVVPPSTDSDVPLAQLHANQFACNGSVAGSMIQSGRRGSLRASASVTSSQVARRRTVARRIPASVAASVRSSSMASTISDAVLCRIPPERKREIGEYLTKLIEDDKRPDKEKMHKLGEQLDTADRTLETATQNYIRLKTLNSTEQERTKNALKLKREAANLVRSAYGMQIDDFRAIRGGGSRIGSDRARSRSRTVERESEPVFLGINRSRATSRAPSEVPPHLFTRERLSPAPGELARGAGSVAGGVGPARSRDTSVARSNRSTTPALVATCKPGNFADLLQNPPKAIKRLKSVMNGYAGSATSQTSTVRAQSLMNLDEDEANVIPKGTFVTGWLSRHTGSRTVSRAGTPGSAFGPMAPPAALRKSFSNVDTPIEIEDDDATVRADNSAIRQGKQRERSRAGSVVSQVSNISARQQRAEPKQMSLTLGVMDGSDPSAPITIEDNDAEAMQQI
ncbi:hypothetical protein PSEUBRA_000457 [Kalmanozyma brasiliensis GHG001]|uniref:uncharacterized protein n=1 Tax=Kalmanozyma brasiliensis (strain GHG001) TaxID=1365824 RepID=UPI002868031B|nr:uncharacterized protein PSEUBRA_000457 [Kalmanozyma brasiliensis GHG001]KAF6766811.1 hypothetical protein PSEUBRA_000457 [Kalmanozyma brasiliensis GHG001]